MEEVEIRSGVAGLLDHLPALALVVARALGLGRRVQVLVPVAAVIIDFTCRPKANCNDDR